MFDRRNRLSAQVAEDVRACLGPAVFDTVVPRAVITGFRSWEFDARVHGAGHHRIDLVAGAGAGGGEVGVGVDKLGDALGGHWCGAWLLFAHTMHPMAFEDIDSATQTQIDADLAEAAGRGINGSRTPIRCAWRMARRMMRRST